MELTERLRAWGTAHAQALSAEQVARQRAQIPGAPDLEREAKVLRERADRLHGEIYRDLDRRSNGGSAR
jgi:hypothetical protein